MTRLLIAASSLVALAATVAPVYAQSSSGPDNPPPVSEGLHLAGPRYGFTFLNDETVNELKTKDLTVKNTISQFGWQFERQFYSTAGGPTVLNEWVLLLGGLDQGVALPSLSWLVGVRTRDGAEFGIGPNVTPAGVALVFAAGVTFRAGSLNIPLNFAIVPSKEGVRVSMLTGFTIHR